MNLGIELSAGAGVPLYVQIHDAISARIDSGVFPTGFRLPATRALAEQLGAHRNTVVRAYEELALSGYVESMVGRGTFVAERRVLRAPDAPQSPRRVPWSSLVSTITDVEPMRRLSRLRAYAGPNVINLSRSQPSSDLLPDELLRRCTEHVLRTRGAKALSYAPRDGVERLREVIAGELCARGVPVRMEDLMITSGSQQALDIVTRALVDPGDTFLVEDATYSGALNVLALSRARVVAVPCDAHGPELSALQRLARGRVKGLYVIPNAQNPTGRTMTAERREALIGWSREFGVPVIEDDYVAGIDFGGVAPPPALRALDRDVLHLGTFSKNLIPALRVGYLIAPPELRETLVSLKSAMDLGTSALLQESLAEFLERGYLRSHLQRTLPEYRKRRDALVGALTELLPGDAIVHTPTRGIAVWLELPVGCDGERVYDIARREGVLIGPGSLNGTHHRHCVRLTFCSSPAEALVEGARRLARAVEIAMNTDVRTSGAVLDVV